MEVRRPWRAARSRAQLVSATAGGGFGGAGLVDAALQLGDLGFEGLEALGDVAEGGGDLAALEAQLGQLAARSVGLGDEALGFAVEAGEGDFGLCLLVAALAGALEQLEAGAAVLLGLLLAGGDGADGILRALLLGLGGLARDGRLRGGVFEEAALRFQLAGEDAELLARLVEVVAAGADARGEFGDAVGVGGHAGGDALQLDGGVVGARAGLADLLVELVAPLHPGGVLGVHGVDGGGLLGDLRGEDGDLRGDGRTARRRAGPCGWPGRRAGGRAGRRAAGCSARPWRPGA